jgi:regulator of CtrA degradation
MEGQQNAGLAATAFFSRTYDEAFGLMREAQDYLLFGAAREWRGLDPLCGLACDAEINRFTARLTYTMTWLLLQRAVHEGEITAREACDEAPALSSVAVCLASLPAGESGLPDRLGALLDRSERLYRRVARLDDMVRRDVYGAEESPSTR